MAPSWHTHTPMYTKHKLHMCNSTLHAHQWNKLSQVHAWEHQYTQMPRCTHIHTLPGLPIAHAFVQGKMCLAGKGLFSVNSYNSSSQTRVLGWAATIPPWPANYCERTYESPHFIHWYEGANCWPSCLITACFVMLCAMGFLVMFQQKHSCEILLQNFTKMDRKIQAKSLRWQILPPRGV